MKSILFFYRRSYSPAMALIFRTTINPNPKFHLLRHYTRLFSDQPQLSVPQKSLIERSPPSDPELPLLRHPPPGSPNVSPHYNFDADDFTTISALFTNPSFPPGPVLESALDQTGIELSPALLQKVFDHFRSSPDSLFTLFQWAERQPGYQSSVGVFNAMIKVLARRRNFGLAWSLILNRLKKHVEGPDMDTFAILIRRYAHADMPFPAIRTWEFVCSLDLTGKSNSVLNLFEILLDSFCKEGLVWQASEYFTRKRRTEHSLVPSLQVYNILLNGWFHSRQLERVEGLWKEMKRENVKPSVVTYGIFVEGYCLMCCVKVAMALVDRMRREGIKPDAIVYNSIIEALGEVGRLQEAMGVMERFLILESGPTISTFNSLVKGFCKAGDLEGANKVLEKMISNGFVPTTTTYNYFFEYFSKYGEVKEGMNLYSKIMECGYSPDQRTFHLLLELLCKQEMEDLAMQVRKEMKVRGYNLELNGFSMLVHLLFKMHRFEEALAEFEDMIQRGVIPKYFTYQKMIDELKKKGMTGMARKLRDMMLSVCHSVNLPDGYPRDEDPSHARRNSIMQKAKAISDTLKESRDPRKLVKRKSDQRMQ